MIVIATVAIFVMASTATNVNAQTNMTTYKDPQGRFTINYPSSWTVVPATNRFEGVAVSFANGNGTNLNIAIPNFPTAGITDPEVVSNIFVNNIQFGNTLFQGTECTKYKIDGFKTCSHISIRDANATIGQAALVQLQVDSFVNGKLYVFTSTGNQDIFDNNLPIFEHMMNSFKVSGMAAGSGIATGSSGSGSNNLLH